MVRLRRVNRRYKFDSENNLGVCNFLIELHFFCMYNIIFVPLNSNHKTVNFSFSRIYVSVLKNIFCDGDVNSEANYNQNVVL